MSSNNLGGEGVSSRLPRSSGAAYTDIQSTSFGYFNSKGQILLGRNALQPFQEASGTYFDPSSVSVNYVSPASVQTFPIRPGGDSSQITANNQAKAIFNAANLQSEQVAAGLRRPQYPIFASHQDLIRYIQGQYTQPIPGTTNTKIYSVNTLFTAPPASTNYIPRRVGVAPTIPNTYFSVPNSKTC